jgi:hypothetical protein
MGFNTAFEGLSHNFVSVMQDAVTLIQIYVSALDGGGR